MASHRTFSTIKSLTWVTDPHLEFLEDIKIVDFARKIQVHSGGAVLITGDISNAQRLAQCLGILAKQIQKPIYFVLGNHDRYHGSFSIVEEIVEEAQSLFPNLTRLRGNEIIPLSDQAALIGIDGWACGTGGIEWRTPVRLNDDLLIEELRRQPTHTARYALMVKLARGYAERLRPTLISALETEIYKELILATHVPPFEGATWHEGQVSGPDYLPLFSSPTIGKMIESEANKFPKKTIRIYCGHTHSSGFFEARNIKVWTGGARYSYPEVQGVIEV